MNGTVFPAVSFGPLAHALCRLIPSSNRTVASYSARALKILILDDALRPQTIVAGVPAVVCAAVKQWEDEILCLRELLGALQTLSWDKQCVKAVLQTDVICNLIDYITASDQEVSVLALATLANILSYCDTLLLTDVTTIETLGKAMPVLIEALKSSQQKPQRLYAAAAIANASFHPRFVALLNQNGGTYKMQSSTFLLCTILIDLAFDCGIFEIPNRRFTTMQRSGKAKFVQFTHIGQQIGRMCTDRYLQVKRKERRRSKDRGSQIQVILAANDRQ